MTGNPGDVQREDVRCPHGFPGEDWDCCRSERDVFVEPYAIESHGHVGSFHSDAQRFSFCCCSCGWSNDTPSAAGMLDLWRRHVASAEGTEWASSGQFGRHLSGGDS